MLLRTYYYYYYYYRYIHNTNTAAHLLHYHHDYYLLLRLSPVAVQPDALVLGESDAYGHQSRVISGDLGESAACLARDA